MAASPLYSAKDLLTFLGCRHSSALDLLHRAGALPRPEEVEDAYLELLKSKGIEHERRHLEALRAEGRSIREIERVDDLNAMAAATLAAMREGIDVIYQGALHRPPWHGYSDFLLRIDTPSELGDWSYEVADTKLARTAKPKHVIQLCTYSELVGLEQGLVPRHASVVLGDGSTVRLRLEDYRHYCDVARERFVDFATASERTTEAEPCGHCEFCRWAARCEAEWEATDHLSRVARISRVQRHRLVSGGVTSLRDLAELPDESVIPRVHGETLRRLRAQARLQHIRRTTGEKRVELLPPLERRGFARLPRPDEGDLFFDMEGDPVYSAEGGLEYLFGFHYLENGEERFTPFWAHDRASEKKAFEDALDFITDRLARYPNAYVYHYASYEETALRRLALKYGQSKKQVNALKRLAQEHGTRENELDDLLRDRKLVDLYRVVRESVLVSEPSYSLKSLEVFFAPERTQAIKEGGESIVKFERWLLFRDDAILRQIEEYNAVDCRSTRLCRDWLVSLRPRDLEWFDPARDAAAEEAEKERERELRRREADARILELREALLRDAGADDRPWRELLGHLLDYHRREARRDWWKFFERREMRTEELIDDPECIGGLSAAPGVAPRAEKRSTAYTLRFPEQETKLGEGDVVRADTGEQLEILSLDERARTLELKVGASRQPLAAEISLIPKGPWDDTTQRTAIARYAQAVVEGGADDYAAVTSILRKDAPRLAGGVILRDPDDLLVGTLDAVRRMEGTHLVIQGPPGSGKTFTSAHAIVDLLRAGKRVGVTAFTHKAINNLLKEVERVARERGVKFTGAKKCSKGDEESRFGGAIIENVEKNDAVIGRDYQLIAGTAWLFSDPDLDRRLDWLFVDEAGQMSLANVVATGVSARNIVLVGDQMQLSQPVKGAHPGGSGVSALDHLMGDRATVPPDRGIFLARTWRMHPDLCRFVSDVFYDGRLESVESTARQRLVLTDDAVGALAAAGLRFVGVEHEERSQRSPEEAARLGEVYQALLGQRWVDADGDTHRITATDILVVSPYNLQVNLLKETLPEGARVGTVDRFQGQEAAVVLISMASSSGEHLPRGLDFLFSRNRLNVAVSRARCLSVIFASPGLLAVPCGRVEHIRLVNTLCWAWAYSESRGT